MQDDLDAGTARKVREATTPWTILRHDAWPVAKATLADAGTDNLSLIAAGTAFWGFAAIVPLLGATVLTYGLIATPAAISANIRALFGVLPRDAANLIADQLAGIVQTSTGKKGGGLILALLLAIYGGTQGASALITALNVAYEEREKRSLFRLYLLAFAITGAAVLLALGAAVSTTATAFLGSLMPGAPKIVLTGVRLGSYLILALMAITAAAGLYRFGPDRAHARWIWLTPGSLIATMLWLAVNAGFAFYAAHLTNYSATYGSLSAVIVLQFWLWLSAYIFLLGAELNSQLERRTAQDTTTGPPAPPGQRGAAVANAAGGEVHSPETRQALREAGPHVR